MNQDIRAASPLQKLRRVHLYKLADMHGIRYRDGAPKLEMVPLLEAAGVDPTKPGPNGQKVVEFQQVKWTDENGREHWSLEPQIPEPQRRNIDYEAAIARAAERSAKEAAAKESAEDEARFAKLEADNKELREQITELLKVVRGGPQHSRPPPKKRVRSTGKPDRRKTMVGVMKLKSMCSAHGLPYDRKDTAAILRERLAAIGVVPPDHLPPEGEDDGENAT